MKENLVNALNAAKECGCAIDNIKPCLIKNKFEDLVLATEYEILKV